MIGLKSGKVRLELYTDEWITGRQYLDMTLLENEKENININQENVAA